MTYTQIKNADVLIDSNIIIYSSNTLGTKYSQAIRFREGAMEGKFHPLIAHQNIIESIRVLTHTTYNNPMSLAEARLHLSAYASFCTVISPLTNTLEICFRLMDKYILKSNATFDAYLVATMLSNNISIIATDNVKHFEIFKEITVFNPFKN